MRMSPKNAAIANDLRQQIQSKTETVSDGEGVAMILLWSFLMDHARCHNIDVSTLARDQLESFIPYAEKNLKVVRQH